jgi:hypothetical protein
LKFSQKLSACLPYRDYHRGCSRRRTTLVPAGIIDQAASDAQSSNGAALIGFDMEDAQTCAPKPIPVAATNEKPVLDSGPTATISAAVIAAMFEESRRAHYATGRPCACPECATGAAVAATVLTADPEERSPGERSWVDFRFL